MATTPELHEPQIAAARAQAWHQAASSQPEAETENPESESEAEIGGQPEAEPEGQNEAQPDAQPEAPSLEASEQEPGEEDSADEGTSSQRSPETPEPSEPTQSPRANSTSNRILTLEAAREFVSGFGLVLFGPRSLGAPAPSLVEATLGTAKADATPAEADIARSLVARLVAEGSAVPLNLLGGPGDIPDFIVSTAAFPFVFTLRGDKGWKRPPETAGAVKVTTLALHVYEALSEKGALTVSEIVTEVGREITESAVTRALSELWSLLRVIPVGGNGGATQWELTTARFLKAVKAGANAGQPTALSALISLYLGQVYLATEDEICAFLSPLTARSRVRDVLHGLSAGRQLDEAVLEGKTVLFLPDSLPDLGRKAESAEPGTSTTSETPTEGHPGNGDEQPATGAPSEERIRRFGGADAGRDRTFRGKPVARPGSSRPPFPRSGARPGASSDRPFRPANRGPRSDDRPPRPFADRSSAGVPPREGASDRPSFSRPWDEEKRNRPSGARPSGARPSGARPSGARPSGARPSGDRPFGDRPSRPAYGDRPAFGARDSRPPRRDGGSFDRPAFGNRDRGDRGDRPSFRRDTPGAPPFRPRPDSGGNDHPFRSSFSGGENTSAPADRGSRPPRDEGRPPRREGAGFFPRRDTRDSGGDRPRPFRPSSDRPAAPRPSRPRSSEDSGSFAPRQSFDRPAREGGSGAGRSFGGGGGFRPREERSEGFRPREDRAGGPPRSGDRGPQGRPPFREGGSGKPFGDRPQRSFGDRPQRSFGDRPERSNDGPRSRPAGQGAERGAFRPGGFSDRPSRGPAGGSGGFNRGPGGPSRGPGGFNRGPGSADRGPGSFKRGPRPDRGAAPGDRPASRPRPEDEA